jgi:CHRD domain
MSLKSVAALAIIAVLAAGAAQAEIVHFGATLAGADEVPANTTAGHGEFSGELETVEGVLVYRATYTGLTGAATMAHLHGPAAPGSNAPPVVAVKDASSPISGTSILTPQQMDDLMAGKWYFNVHSAAHPGGEIRGQVKRLN